MLIDAWRARIAPARYLDTFAAYGNLVTASALVTLAEKRSEIDSGHLALGGIGPGLNASAVLIET